MLILTCPFKINSSHSIENPGFSGSNKISLNTPITFNDINIVGKRVQKLAIEEIDSGSYRMVIESDDLNKKEDGNIDFLNSVGNFLSLQINENEQNPHYGNCFVDIDIFNCKIESDRRDVVVGDSTAIETTRPVVLTKDKIESWQYHDSVGYFYNGLRAEHPKSKFIHWFMILEKLEYSDGYKRLFRENYLFADNERVQIEKFIKTLDSRKGGRVQAILSWTEKNRAEKLAEYLQSIGILKFKAPDKVETISESVIQDILEARNKIVHTGKVPLSVEIEQCLTPL